ncbi:MAG: N-acetyl-gamma-glutamyl-phosphate reductase [Rhodospirillales bacterium]
MPSVFIDGEAGTTGLEIRQRLARLPLDVHSIAPDMRKDPAARRALMAAVDVAILCLPEAASREAVALADELGRDAPRILDASTAFRTDPSWAYGFPELNRSQQERVEFSMRVSNPGCYAQGAIALLRPLVDGGLLPADFPVVINAVSGYSGAGRPAIEAHERDGGPAFELYALGLEHKHVPEIELYGGLTRRPLFVPSVGHFRQGMLVSIPLHLDELPSRPSGADLRAALAARYADSRHVRVMPAEGAQRLEATALNNTDRMELSVFANEALRHAVLVARLDNLGKGAAGAAVQNLLLMLGLAEEASPHG